MTFLTSPVVLQRFIQIIYAILIIAGIVNVFFSVMRKVKPIYVVLACITLALAFFSALFLNWEMYETSGGFPYSLAARIVRLPLWILLTYTVLLATTCVTGLVMLHFYGKTRLSAMSLKESLDSVYRRVFCGDQRTPSSCQCQNERIVYGGDGKITAERGFFLDGIDRRKRRCRGNGGSDRRQSDGKI